ncbi:glycerol-3-phosphate phosphatase-like isoform X1 [Coccinella septempunctata]|uniref:glycerol-3-phosphate phosphatase-like isoform X1 n=1 Tax=Coccinella septempunctata TaxID=41139 RepID=UPI001D07ABDB|nr:glycerol-3-phosphate phosphatase-like isoform X1 [Coccinella septempunctata]
MYHSSCTELTNISNHIFWRFFNSFDTVLTCCEGVLWNSDKEIKGSSVTLNRLRECGKQIFFFTNNTLRTREEVVSHAEKLGFVIHKNEVVTSSFLTAYYLRSQNFNDTAYVIGSRGLAHELETFGITYIGTGPDPSSETIHETYLAAKIEPNVKAVVVGLDEHFSLSKMIKAATYLEDPTCEFVALNSEERRSGFSPKAVPSTGAILTAIETCSGRKAKILGKPSKYIMEYLKMHHCIDAQRTLLLGDRLKIDILLGQECGFQTLIVLSGMTQTDEVHAKLRSSLLGETTDGLLPDLYTKSLEDMLPFLKL